MRGHWDDKLFFLQSSKKGGTLPLVALNGKVSNQYQHKKRKLVSKHVLHLQRKCVLEFCHSDEASRIDSNSHHIAEMNLPNGGIEKHVRRLWTVLTIYKQHKLFKQSKTVSTYKFLYEYEGFVCPSRRFFIKINVKVSAGHQHNLVLILL